MKIHEHQSEATMVQNIESKPTSQDSTEQSLGMMPTIDFRMQTARLLVQLARFKQAITILEITIKEDDESIEAWYLLAFSLFKRQKWTSAKECCLNIHTTC